MTKGPKGIQLLFELTVVVPVHGLEQNVMIVDGESYVLPRLNAVGQFFHVLQLPGHI